MWLCVYCRYIHGGGFVTGHRTFASIPLLLDVSAVTIVLSVCGCCAVGRECSSRHCVRDGSGSVDDTAAVMLMLLQSDCSA